jgi:hypothetical protein
MWRFDQVSDKKSTARDLVVAFARDLVFAFAPNLRYLGFNLVFAFAHDLVKGCAESDDITAYDIVNC